MFSRTIINQNTGVVCKTRSRSNKTPHSQPFWGNMVAKAGAGPEPIPHAELTVENLGQAIRYCLSQQAAEAAVSIAEQMKSEAGVRAAARSFHRQLPLELMRCDLIPTEPAVWTYSKSKRPIRLSKVAAQIVLSKTSTESKHMKMSVDFNRPSVAYLMIPNAYLSPQVPEQPHCHRDHQMGPCVRWSLGSHGDNNGPGGVRHGNFYQANRRVPGRSPTACSRVEAGGRTETWDSQHSQPRQGRRRNLHCQRARLHRLKFGHER